MLPGDSEPFLVPMISLHLWTPHLLKMLSWASSYRCNSHYYGNARARALSFMAAGLHSGGRSGFGLPAAWQLLWPGHLPHDPPQRSRYCFQPSACQQHLFVRCVPILQDCILLATVGGEQHNKRAVHPPSVRDHFLVYFDKCLCSITPVGVRWTQTQWTLTLNETCRAYCFVFSLFIMRMGRRQSIDLLFKAIKLWLNPEGTYIFSGSRKSSSSSY